MIKLLKFFPSFLAFITILGVNPAFAQPVNNDCVNAISLPINEHYVPQEFDYQFGTVSAPAQCTGNWASDVWFQFVATTENIVIVLEDNPTMLLEVFSNSCNGTRVYCSEWQGDFNIIDGAFVVGRTYFIRASKSTYPSNTTKFKIGLNEKMIDPGCTPASKRMQDTLILCDDIVRICGDAGICGNSFNDGGQSTYWTEQYQSGCFSSINNITYFKFVAQDTLAQFTLFGEGLPGSNINRLRCNVFSFDNNDQLFCDNGDVTFVKCYTYIDLNSYGAAGVPLYFGGLTIGQEYFFSAQAFGGIEMTFRVFPIKGIEVEPSVTPKIEDLCVGDSVLLRAHGGDGTYQWDNNPDLSTNTGDSIWATPTTVGANTYTVQSQGVHASCQQSGSTEIHLNQPVTPDAGMPQSGCENDTIDFTGIPTSATNQVIWTNTNNEVIFRSGSIQPTLSATGTQAGSYTLNFGEASPGCPYQFDQVQFNVLALPNIDAGNDFTFCNTDSVNISATGGLTYNWSEGLGSGDTHRVLPSDTITYFVTGNDGTCSNIDSITVRPDTVPDLQFTFDTVCLGNETIVYVTGANFHFWTGISGSPDSIIVNLTESTSFDVLGVNDVCSAFESVQVDIFDLPFVTMDSFEEDTICRDNSAIPLPNAMPAGGTYIGQGVMGSTLFTSSVPDGANTIRYQFSDQNGCINRDSATLFIQNCLGGSDLDANGFQVYPNPVNSELTLVFKQAVFDQTIVIMDVTGRVVSTVDVNGKMTKLNVSHWANGTYMLVLSDGHDRFNQKIIVAH